MKTGEKLAALISISQHLAYIRTFEKVTFRQSARSRTIQNSRFLETSICARPNNRIFFG
jgi:hypothetical protein